MLAYTAHRRSQRQLSGSTLTMIVGIHVVALGFVAAVKMDIPIIPKGPDTQIINVPAPPPPPDPIRPVKPTHQTVVTKTAESHIDPIQPIMPTLSEGPTLGTGSGPITLGNDLGPVIDTPLDGGTVEAVKPPVKLAARSLTPQDLIRPPYPDSKRRSEEEAVLRLRLSIDESGRVTAVDPVGAADPAFLASARSHVLRFWRYKPATEDGRPVPTTMVVTLRFELEA